MDSDKPAAESGARPGAERNAEWDSEPAPPAPSTLPPYLTASAPGRRGWPVAFAHRGADPARENTFAAFRSAVECGFTYLELDVQTSRDGVLVVFHDDTLERITDGTGTVAEHTWAELAELRVVGDGAARRAPGGGEPLLRFEDLLTAWEDVHLNVDMKDGASAEPLAALVARHDAWDRVLVTSFVDARRRRFTRAAGRRPAMSGGALATSAVILGAPFGLAPLISRRLARIQCVQVPVSHRGLRVVTERFIERCHAAELQVHVWVVDDPAEMERLLAWGVDGLMTDDADALASVLAARGCWPQR